MENKTIGETTITGIESDEAEATAPVDAENSTSETTIFTVDNITVTFPATVGMTDVAALKKVLDTQILGCAVSIDTSAVDVIDTSILQALLLFCKEADHKGVFTVWESPSPAVLDAIRLLGLSGIHGLPEAA